MAYDVDIVRSGHGCDAEKLGQATTPHNIRLNNIDRLGVE